jgi:DNA-binding transcriptional MerR regulator
MLPSSTKVGRRLTRPFFYQGDVLEIAAISADTLLTWHKRGLIPEPTPREGGRGHRRLYSVREAFYLAILKKLADVHYPLGDANTLAGKLVNKVIALAFLSPGESIVALYPPDQFEDVPVHSDRTIARWMKERKLDFATFLDLTAFAEQVYGRYDRVLQSRRNSPARRQALAELLNSQPQRD